MMELNIKNAYSPPGTPDYKPRRREFLGYSVSSIVLSYSGLSVSAATTKTTTYPIADEVKTTVDRLLSFALPEKLTRPDAAKGLAPTELHRLDQYREYGYGHYTYGPGLPIEHRLDLMPEGYVTQGVKRLSRLSSFFTGMKFTSK